MESKGDKKRKGILSFFKPTEHTSASEQHASINDDMPNCCNQYPSKIQRVEVDVGRLERDLLNNLSINGMKLDEVTSNWDHFNIKWISTHGLNKVHIDVDSKVLGLRNFLG